MTFTQPHSSQHTTLYTASGTPIQIVSVPASDGTYHGYKTGAARTLGFIQIACGIVIFVSQIVLTALNARGYQGMAGFWAPPVFLLAGAFGVQSSKSKSTCTVVTTMVLSIIAIILSIGPITQASIGVGVQRKCHTRYNGRYYYDHCIQTTRHQVAIACHAFTLIGGITEAIMAILAAAYCCHGCGCYQRPGVVIGQHSGLGGGQVVTGGCVQVSAVQYQAAPAQFYSPPVAPGQPGPYPGRPGQYPGQPGQPGQCQAPKEAPAPLPTYSDCCPPPEYQEKA